MFITMTTQRSIWTATCTTLLLLLRPAYCQQQQQRDKGPPGAPDAAHYRFRIGHSVAVAGPNLYIDGGEVVSGPPGNTSSQFVNSDKTAIIPLTEKWHTKDPGISVIDRGDFGLRVTETTLWAAESGIILFSWGGSVGSKDQLTQNSHLRLLVNRWANDSTVPTRADGQKIVRTRAGSWTTCNGVGFLLGGATPLSQDAATQFAAVPGLVTFEMRSRRWNNVSADAFGPAGAIVGGTHVGGAAVCLPTFGTNGAGLVVFLGGKQATGLGVGATLADVPFETIYFYDMGTGKFHSQFATQHSKDARPVSRSEFCAVATRPPSNSSYEIIIFGGRNGGSFAGVHILTIPGFRWFKVPDAQGPRYQHGCAVIGRGRRQMLSVGGIESWESKFSGGIADPWHNGLKVFDMTTLTWSDTYDPAAPAYETPDQIKSWYDAGGRQSVKWDNPSTEALFRPAMFSQGTNNPGSNATVPIGVIVGAVIGGIAVLLIAIGLCIFLRRGSRPHDDKKPQEMPANDDNDDDDNDGNDKSKTLESSTLVELPSGGSEKLDWGSETCHELGKDEKADFVITERSLEVHEMHAGDVPREMSNYQISPPHELPATQARQQPRQRQEDKTLGSFIPPDARPPRQTRPEAMSATSPWEDDGFF